MGAAALGAAGGAALGAAGAAALGAAGVGGLGTWASERDVEVISATAEMIPAAARPRDGSAAKIRKFIVENPF